MNAPADLHGRILVAIAKATSQRPAHAADVLALVGGEELAYWAAIEQLYVERRINTAHIKKKPDPEPWLAIWPTGVCLPATPQSGKTLSGLFVRHRLGDFHAAHAPRSNPKPETAPRPAPIQKTEPNKEPFMDMPANKRRPHGTLQEVLAQHMAGRGIDNAVTVTELANLLCDAPQNIRFAVQAMATKGALLVTERKNGGRTAAAYYDATTAPAEAEKPAATPVQTAAEVLAQIADAAAEPDSAATVPAVDRRAPQPLYRAGDLTVSEVPANVAVPVGVSSDKVAHVTDFWECAAREGNPDSHIEFALWSDGRLDIVDGAELFQIPPGAVKRLALLLGVPGTTPFPPLGA